jgi:mono/diheme cytochrome c family protein
MYINAITRRFRLFLRNSGLALFLAGAVSIGARAQEAQQNQDQKNHEQHKQQGEQKQQLPDGPGKEALERVCSACHGAEIVLGRGLTRDGWTQVVTDMIQRGAQGSEDDFAQIVDYLATNFPPKSDSGTKPGTK